MILEVCRWLVPAVLSAACGVSLALWMHDGDIAEPSAPAPAAAPEQGRQSPPMHTPRVSEATPTASASEPAAAPAGRLDQLATLARRLNRQARVDVEAALTTLLALPPHVRDYLAEDLVRRVAKRAPQHTLQWLEENVIDTALREHLLSSASAGVAAADPAFALNRVQALTDPETRRLAVRRVLETWAESDPAAAFEWIRAEGGAGAAELLVTVLQIYAKHDPVQAGELVLGLPEGEARHRLLDQHASALAESDAPAAAAWLSQLPEDAVSASAFSSVFERWAEQDPWMALEQASALDGELAFELVGTVVQSVAARRPELLATSLDRLPEDFRALAAHRLADVWADERPRLARQWVETLPPGEVRDEARRGLDRRGRRGAASGA